MKGNQGEILGARRVREAYVAMETRDRSSEKEEVDMVLEAVEEEQHLLRESHRIR